MAIFNLDIERYIIEQQESGKELRGIACLQYPLYCVHSQISEISSDPLEDLDKYIAQLIDSGINNEVDISNILSVPLSGVKHRLDQFELYEYLNEEKSNLSQYGFNVLIKSEEKKIQKRSYDFFVDGITLNPLSNIFYTRKYKKAMAEELKFTFYTDEKGNIRSYSAFSPSIVHTPFNGDKAKAIIEDIEVELREEYNIPVGLEEIEKMSFSKLTLPILIALFDNDDNPTKEVIDGFNSLGEAEHFSPFEENISKRLQNLELRLNLKRDRDSNKYYDFEFNSNWNEIDVVDEKSKLFLVFKEDLKTALEHHYSIKNIPIENIISEKNEIGIKISKSILLEADKPRQILNNLRRGRDYQMTSRFFRTGIWITFFSFNPMDEFSKQILEVLDFIDIGKSKKLDVEQYIKRFESYENYREMLILLEEFDLLEKIDIAKNMIQI